MKQIDDTAEVYKPDLNDLVDLPAWITELLGKTPDRAAADTEPVVDLDQAANIEWAVNYLTHDAPWAIETKGGDLTTVKVAMTLREHGISRETAKQLMAEHYNQFPTCDPLWQSEELERKVDNGYNYAHLEAPGGKTAESDFADDPPDYPPLTPLAAKQAADRKKLAAAPHVIHFDPGDLPRIAREVQAIIIECSAKDDARASDQIFVRTDALVHLSRNRLKPGTEIDKNYHVENELLIRSVEDSWLADRLERDILFFKPGRAAGGKSKPKSVRCAVPPIIVSRMQGIKPDWKYPALAGTVETPTLRQDGTILSRPGYDLKSGLYYDPGEAKFPDIKDRPTKADAVAALSVLAKPLANFPFADEDGIDGLSRSVALAMLLTSVCRRSLKIAPMFGIDANEAQSGKTELAQIPAIIMTGRRTGERPLATDEYQRSTALAAAFEAGDAVILYDNIDGEKQAIEGAALCMALTGDTFQMRRLGGNSKDDQVIAPTHALLVADGNHLTASGDMTEDRMLICKLKSSKPLAERQFDHWPLDAWVIETRPALVSAALTILRAYAVATDRKPGSKFRFAEWRERVADALVWLGEPDPVLSTTRVKADDPVREAQREVMRAWAHYIGDANVTTAEALAHPDVLKAIADARGLDSERKLSKKGAANYLKGMVGIQLLGYSLSRFSDTHENIVRWRATLGEGATPIEMATPATDESDAIDFSEDGQEFADDDALADLL